MEAGSDAESQFMRTVSAEVATALAISRDHIEVTQLAGSDDTSGAASTECELTLSTPFSSLPSLPVFEADMVTRLAEMLGIDEERVELTGIFEGSTTVKFILHAESAPVANSTATVEQLLSRLDTLADPSTWRDGTSILDYFDEFVAWEGGQVATIVDVTFKIASEATADGSRTVIDLLHELNQAVSTGTLGSLRLPAGQDVFDSLVMACPAGTYQEPTEGCVPCPPGEQPTESQDACIACPVWALQSNLSSVFSEDGRACLLCPAGRGPDSLSVACEDCPTGTAADGTGPLCSACQDPTMAPNSAGTRCECRPGYVDGSKLLPGRDEGVSAVGKGGRCIPCEAGFESDAARASCVRCGEGTAKPGLEGTCQVCPEEAQEGRPATVASTDGRLCLPCAGVFTTAGETSCKVSAGGMFLLIVLVLGLGGGATMYGIRHYLHRTGKPHVLGITTVVAAKKYALQLTGGEEAMEDDEAKENKRLEREEAKARKLEEKEARRSAKESAKAAKQEEKAKREEEKARLKHAKAGMAAVKLAAELKVLVDSGTHPMTPRLEDGEVAEAPAPEPLNCEGGHGLTAFETLNDGYNCDVCGVGDLPMGTPLWGCTICDHDVCSRCYDEALSGAEPEPEPEPDDERYGEKDNKWQQWLARYISPETEVEDFLSSVGVEPAVSVLPETWHPRGAARVIEAAVASRGDEEEAAPPPPPLPADGSQPPRTRGVADLGFTSAADLPGSPVVAHADEEERAKAERWSSWASDRHASSIPMPTSLTASFGARRPLSAAMARVDPSRTG